MASVGFDKDSVTTLMSLVDEHKDDIKEGEYLKLCNLMKFLFSQQKNEVPQSQPQPQVRITNADVIQILYRKIITLQNQLLSDGRVTVYDKINALTILFQTHSIPPLQHRFSDNKWQVLAMENELHNHVKITKVALKTLYKEQKTKRIEERRNTNKMEIRCYQRAVNRMATWNPDSEWYNRPGFPFHTSSGPRILPWNVECELFV